MVSKSLAPLWELWEDEYEGEIPSSSPIGEPGPPLVDWPLSPRRILVELFLNGGWVDITSKVRRDEDKSITIKRGRSDEGANTDPSTCNLTIDNTDGWATPRNPNSPYFGILGRNTPIRVRVVNYYAAGWRTRFVGEVSSWPPKWTTAGEDVWTPIQGSGILRRLTQGVTPLKSFMYRRITKTYTPLVYWPCEDGETSFSIASGLVDGSTMSYSGIPTLHSNTEFPSSDSLVVLESATLAGTVPATSATGQLQFRFLLSVPSGGTTDSTVIARLRCSGTLSRWDLVYTTAGSGTLTPKAYDRAGVLVLTGGTVTGLNGKAVRVTLELADDRSTDVDYAIKYYDSTDGSVTGTSGSVVTQDIGYATSVSFNPNLADLSGVAIGHITVENNVQSSTLTVENNPYLGSEVSGYTGETAGARLQRLCVEESVSIALIGGVADTSPMGPQRIDTLINLLRECEDTDAGFLYESREEFALQYRTRYSLYNRSTTLALSYSAHQLDSILPDDDDLLVRNDIKVSRKNGSSAIAVLEEGSLSIQPPPDGVGRYDEELTINTSTDDVLPDHAGWHLHLGTVDESRYPEIAMLLNNVAFTGSLSLSESVLDLDVGSRLTVSNLPTWLPPGNAAGNTITEAVLGLTETLSNFEHMIEVNCTPELPYHIGVYSTANNSPNETRYAPDPGGSTLATDISTTATSFDVITAAGSATWGASSSFTILIGGERMTVTGISGSSSPQTFTVTRSVNGIVKTHKAGDVLSLFLQRYYAF